MDVKLFIGYTGEVGWLLARCCLTYLIIRNSSRSKKPVLTALLWVFISVSLSILTCRGINTGAPVYNYMPALLSVVCFSLIGAFLFHGKVIEKILIICYFWENMDFLDYFIQTLLYVFKSTSGSSDIRVFQFLGVHRGCLLLAYAAGSLLLSRHICNIYNSNVRGTALTRWPGIFICFLFWFLNRFFQRVYITKENLVTNTYLFAWLLIMMFLTGGIVLYYLLRRRWKIQGENAVLQVKLSALEKENQTTAEKLIQRRELIHDIKNHMRILYGYVEREEYTKAKNYLKYLYPDMETPDDEVFSGCDMLDRILNIKREEGETLGITSQFSSDDMTGLLLADIEICSLFGNLLDNAMEAQLMVPEEKRYISLKLRRHMNMLYIDISNPYLNELRMKNGRFQSTKEDGKEHGFGTRLIERIVARYQGEQLIETDNHIFRYRIMMKAFQNLRTKDRESADISGLFPG